MRLYFDDTASPKVTFQSQSNRKQAEFGSAQPQTCQCRRNYTWMYFNWFQDKDYSVSLCSERNTFNARRNTGSPPSAIKGGLERGHWEAVNLFCRNSDGLEQINQ